jgi:TniQ
MHPARLPIAVPPARHETIASYLTRLASPHGISPGELAGQISVRAPGTARHATDPGRLAAITGRPAGHLGLALPELRDPGPDWQAWRHQPQPLCPRCDARHDGGPVTRLRNSQESPRRLPLVLVSRGGCAAGPGSGSARASWQNRAVRAESAAGLDGGVLCSCPGEADWPTARG